MRIVIYTTRLHPCQGVDTIEIMHLWDYREKDLKKTAWGRRLILERMINYGPGRRKISLNEVKKNWDKLDLDPLRRRLLKLLIWGN